jgi:D-psicose/D-tagatose/L-ribulose 3-epimerase
MRIGINLLLWTTEVGTTHEPIFWRLRASGYDGVEVPLDCDDPGRCGAVRRILDDCGLAATAITTMTADANPISSEAPVRRRAVDRLRRSIEAAHVLGSPVLGGPLHSACKLFVNPGPTADEKRWCAEVLSEAAIFAKGAGVTLALEQLNRFESHFLNTAQQTREILSLVSHPNCAMHYDTHHAHIEESDPGAAIRASAEVIAHVHVSENHRGAPGSGQVNWRGTFEALSDIRYDNWVVIEAFSTSVPDFAASINVWRNPSTEQDIVEDGLAFVRSLVQQYSPTRQGTVPECEDAT